MVYASNRRQKEHDKKYRNSVHGKEVRAKWLKSPAGKKSLNKLRAKWNNSRTGKNYMRRHDLKRKYGITIAQRNKMVREQHGRCYICKKPEKVKDRSKIKRLSVDEDPKTHKVRHLLCQKCNFFVGRIEKSNPPIEHYLRYIKENKTTC